MKGILVDDNGDLVIRGGHIATGDNRTQCAQHLIGAFTGEYKYAPLLGGNARNMICVTPDPFWAGNVKSQLRQCLIEAERLEVGANTIEIELKD